MAPESIHVLELSECKLKANGSGFGTRGFSFVISKGDICAIEAETPDDAHLFLRVLAGLIRPIAGTFHLDGKQLEVTNYKEIIRYKHRIAYIAPDAALISNLTVRQNLLLSRYYFENSLTIKLDEKTCDLCRDFGISTKLDDRPATLSAMEVYAAIIIRELKKEPRLLLLNQPENLIGHDRFDLLTTLFSNWIARSLPVVFLSYERRLIRRFANRKITIFNGSLEEETG
jgi:ABC-type molybdate transport system ATPase subunit